MICVTSTKSLYREGLRVARHSVFAILVRQALDQGHIVSLQQDLAQILPALRVVRLCDLSHFDRIINLASELALVGQRSCSTDRTHHQVHEFVESSDLSLNANRELHRHS